MAKTEGNKGVFGKLQLALARRYVFPESRRSMIILGGVGCLGVLAYFVIDFAWLKSSFTASGPVSSFHANFEKDCSSCHEQFKAATSAKCSVCHEKTGDALGVYSFAAHDVYRSGDLSRIKTNAEEHQCSTCHLEHAGREAMITEVPDERCITCHEFGSFNRNHPQFDFVAQQTPDDSTLRFPHIQHVKEVVKQEKLTDIERACLYCHNPQPDGKHFEPIAFNTHCSSCHLKSNSETPPLRIRRLGDPAPGVELFEDMQRRGGPAMVWAKNMSASEFQLKSGNRVVKSPIRHADPWILENLRALRRMLYPENGLTDLIKASGAGAVPPQMPAMQPVYDEALQTLRGYAEALRGRPEPELQRELVKIDSLLKVAQNKIRRQTFAAKDAKLFMPAMKLNSRVSPEQAQEINAFADDLTRRCQRCHVVANAAIQRVQKDQQVLRRAEFNHRAHILQRRCLDCHTEIPILAQTTAAATTQPVRDQSAIQNIPEIANCRSCHNSSETSNRCVTCHFFHPNKTNRSSLLMYLD